MNIKLERDERILLGLLISTIIVSSILCLAFGVYVNNNEKTKVLIQDQNKELREENKRLVDKTNYIVNEYEKLEKTLNVKHYEESFLKALINATFVYETGHGESDLWLSKNNAGGIKGYYSGEYLTYESQAHGLTHLESLLKESYINVYGYDVIAIRKAYDPNYTEEQLNDFVNIFKTEFEKTMNGDY